MRGYSHRPSRLMLVLTAAALAIALPVLACEAGGHSCASDAARAASLAARADSGALSPLAAVPVDHRKLRAVAGAADMTSATSIGSIAGTLRI